MKELSLTILGMDCAACAATLERALRRVRGIERVIVNYTAASAELTYDDAVLSLEDVVMHVKKAGYAVPREEADLQISAGADLAAVRRALCALYGVSDVTETGEGQLTVAFWPVELDGRTLLSACREAGAEAELKELRGGEEYHQLDTRMRLLRTLLVSAGLTAPLMLELHPKTQFLLGTALQLGPARHFYSGALRSLRSRTFGMDLLVSLSSTAIWLYSSYVALTRKSNFTLYFSSQGALLSLILFGKYMEQIAAGEASAAVRKLLRLQPRTAMVLRDGQARELDVDRIRTGDEILLRPGERVPVDGVILRGACAVDESMLTGESMPVDKSEGDTLVGGSINRSGSAVFRATTLGKDSVLQRIAAMVRQAQIEKAPVQRFADAVAQWFVPGVAGAAAATFALWYFRLKRGDLEAAVLNCCDVLTVACPCALGLATPTALMVGASVGSEQGVLFKNGAELEHAWKSDTIVFDKTGTLTAGAPTVTDVVPLEGVSEEELLAVCAAVEQHAEHPIAKAVTAYAQTRLSEAPAQVSDFRFVFGRGVTGVVNGEQVLCGSRALLAEHGISLAPLQLLPDLRAQAKTELCAARGGRLIGVLAVADTLREEAREAVAALQASGREIWMLTGDHAETAAAVAASAGISHYVSQVLPEDKARRIEALKREGKTVCMVGDGVNDTPALAASDCAVAIGTGSDIAIDSAGILLPAGDLTKLASVFRISEKTNQIIRQNLRWALLYNVLSIPLAASGLLHPSLCAAAMSCSSIGVLMNSLRLRGVIEKGKRLWKKRS